MKKSIVLAGVFATMALVSCKKTEATVSDATTVDSSAIIVGDSAAVVVDDDAMPVLPTLLQKRWKARRKLLEMPLKTAQTQ